MQEMFYRHLYATVQPTLEQRCDSWDNYCALFNIILGSSINMQVFLLCLCIPFAARYYRPLSNGQLGDHRLPWHEAAM